MWPPESFDKPATGCKATRQPTPAPLATGRAGGFAHNVIPPPVCSGSQVKRHKFSFQNVVLVPVQLSKIAGESGAARCATEHARNGINFKHIADAIVSFTLHLSISLSSRYPNPKPSSHHIPKTARNLCPRRAARTTIRCVRLCYELRLLLSWPRPTPMRSSQMCKPPNLISLVWSCPSECPGIPTP